MTSENTIRVLHINDKIEISGGVETNISQLCQFSNDYGIQTEWIGIYKKEDYIVKSYRNPKEYLFKGETSGLLDYITKFIQQYSIDLIHIHSLSAPKIIRHCFSLAPVVRSMREPRMFCPGQGKFWRKSERICNQPFGLHCFYHAYKEGCVNRHPKRLFNAYQNVKFEVSEGAKNYAAIFVMSTYMKEESLKVGYSEEQLVLNPHFTPLVEEKELVDKSEAKTKHLIFVGRLSSTKGVHYFIKAGINLLNEGYEVCFDIVGDGHDANFLKGLVPSNYKDQFIFHGWQSREQIDKLLHQAYLMVFPSIYPEAFGISGIEAMMRGKPVVGFDVGGVSTWLKETKTGFLVRPKNTKGLASKIKRLLEDKALYMVFSQQAREVSVNDFSVERHMNTLLKSYKKAINVKV